ncbi:hypothetical protein Epro_0780 [Endomicrobium proavitum]|uniref:Peptidoglycan peptidase n=2 Tax=Endomicrobium proavitum TaxID=1408281 RepID=A0A0G3WKY2_9BACT|nr:hypothetical protein Epro_0780 [Endomicrobium proavitum]
MAAKGAISIIVIFLAVVFFLFFKENSYGGFQNGDIIFQTSLSQQSKAIQVATGSKFSHCGIVFEAHGGFYVLEAVQPVKYTPVNDWIARGKDKKFVVRRLKNAEEILDYKTVEKLMREGDKFLGKDYDLVFEWSDDKIYCSELIWKIYKRGAEIEVGKLQKLRDFNLDDKTVASLMKKRYGANIPLDETVISPKAIFESDLLETVKIKK